MSTSLLDPDGNNAVSAAAQWLVAIVTGSSATIVSTLAIAGIGLLMLQGRIPVKRAAVAIVGCFVIFGSSTIATAIVQLIDYSGPTQGQYEAAQEVPLPPAQVPPPAQPHVYDPYAGASVPVQ